MLYALDIKQYTFAIKYLKNRLVLNQNIENCI